MSKFWKVAAIGAIGAFALAPPTFAAKGGAGGGGDANHGPTGYSKGTDAEGVWTFECPDDDGTDDTLDFVGDTNNWPPNHRTVDSLLIAKGDSDDDITLTATASSDDETADLDGNGADDFAFGGPGAGKGEVRASMTTVRERSGNTAHTGDNSGRVYRIHATATFSDGDSPTCEADFCTRTPHDMRQENRDWEPCQAGYDS